MAIFDSLERFSSSPTVFLAVSTAVLLAAYVLVVTYSRRIPANAPPAASDDFPLTGAIRFWTQRWDWYRHSRQQTTTGNFSFHAGPNTLVALSGEKGRRLFFESRDLGFTEGCVNRQSQLVPTQAT
jgi:sterol 14-demethylase